MTPIPIQRGIIEPQAGGAALRETLFATGGRLQNFDLSDGIPTDSPNFPAGTHDGLDATADAFDLEDDGFGNATCGSVILWAMDPATYAGAISFVRVVVRAAKTDALAAATEYMAGSISPFGAAPFGAALVLTATGVYEAGSFDIAADPADALPWTAAKINARSWGVNINIFGIYSGIAQTVVPELRLEVWG